MVNNKFFNALIASGAILVLAQGCGTEVEDPTDGTPTETPSATATPGDYTPEYLDFRESTVDVACDTDYIDMYAYVDGWTEDGTAWFGIYDNPDWSDYFEMHDAGTIDYHEAPYWEDLGVELDIVALADQTSGVSTIFACDNVEGDFLTYSFCSEDYFYDDGEWCLFWGHDPSYWATEMGY